jgi:hypothetical protein
MIYVDKLFTMESRNKQAFFVGTRTGHKWCHLFCDPGDVGNLHALAQRIGLKRSWFQSHSRTPHYDLVPSKRALALKHGAVEIDAREWYRKQRDAAAAMAEGLV